MKHTYIRIAGVILLSLVLGGCLYPQNQLQENQAPYQEQLERVQTAVDNYREDQNGLVPIRTKPNETAIFEKYLIDFTILRETGHLGEIPGNAYEKGGIYQYTLITPEEDPRVRLIDLNMTEALRSVNVKLDIFRNENIYPAYGEKVADGIYTVNYEKLKLDGPPTVKSPYSNENLPILMDVDGNLFIDYRIDLMKALDEFDHEYEEGDDIRYIIADNTPFVPAYSIPYTLEDGEPVFLPQTE